MRTVVMDPNGGVVDENMIPIGTLLPVAQFITKTPTGEPVLVVQIDPQRQPQGIWNLAALG